MLYYVYTLSLECLNFCRKILSDDTLPDNIFIRKGVIRQFPASCAKLPSPWKDFLIAKHGFQVACSFYVIKLNLRQSFNYLLTCSHIFVVKFVTI